MSKGLKCPVQTSNTQISKQSTHWRQVLIWRHLTPLYQMQGKFQIVLECGLAAATGSTYTCAGDKLIWFVLSPESEIPFHQCCLPTIPLRRDSVSCQEQWWHLQGAWVRTFILWRWGILAAEGCVLCRERHRLGFSPGWHPEVSPSWAWRVVDSGIWRWVCHRASRKRLRTDCP